MYAELATYNLTSGPQVLVCYANDVTSGVFLNMFLAALWLIIVGGSYMIQKRTSGLPNFPVSLVLGGWTVAVTTIILRLISCGTNSLVPDITLAVSLGAAILSVLALFFWQ